MNTRAIFTHPHCQRRQVERFQRLSHSQLFASVSHKQCAIHEEDIRLNATKTMIQRIGERPLAPIVVMRMSILQRLGGVNRGSNAAEEDEDQSAQCSSPTRLMTKLLQLHRVLTNQNDNR